VAGAPLALPRGVAVASGSGGAKRVSVLVVGGTGLRRRAGGHGQHEQADGHGDVAQRGHRPEL
jgi:hypothetical protein